MLRLATDLDVDSILRWRNQAANRDVSNNAHEISADEHASWWARASVDPTRRVLIYERTGRGCGAVNFFDLDLTAEEPVGYWGFFLDGEGLAASGETVPAWIEVMRDAVAYAFDELGLAELRGEVLEHNTPVRQMNRQFRFTEGKPEHRVIGERGITVYPISLRRENRRGARSQTRSA